MLVLSSVQKDTVILPGLEGVFGVKANHVALISQVGWFSSRYRGR
jgi:F0F1-type ATP synthase epsilon subunit